MKFRDLHPNIQIRIITSFLTRSVGTMVFPFMAIYFSMKMGLFLAGVLLTINVLVSIITSLYGGYIADRWGRKRVMILGQSAQVIAFAMMAYANSIWLDSAWLTFYMMLVQSFSSGMTNPAAEAMLIDVSTKENRKYMYSINYWSVNLAIAIGSLFGGLLFESHRFELFVALTIVSIITLYLMAFYMKESLAKTNQERVNKISVWKDIVQNYQLVMKDRLFVWFSLAYFLVVSIEFHINNYIGVRLAREFPVQIFSLFDWFSFEIDGLKMLSWVRIENTLLVVFATALVTRWMKKYNDAYVLYSGVFLYVIGYSILSYSNHFWVLLFVIFIATIGELMYVPVKQSYLAEIVHEEARSSYMAIYGLVFQGAKVWGSIGISLGAILPSWAMSSVYLLMGFFGLKCFHIVLSQLEVHAQNRKEAVVN